MVFRHIDGKLYLLFVILHYTCLQMVFAVLGLVFFLEKQFLIIYLLRSNFVLFSFIIY